MSKLMVITAVGPGWNAEHLENAGRSLRDIDVDWKVVTDTEDFIKIEEVAKDVVSNTYVLQNRSNGTANARNTALYSRTECKYVYNLDHDDEFISSGIENAVEALEHDSSIGWACGASLDYDEDMYRMLYDPGVTSIPKGQIEAGSLLKYFKETTGLPYLPGGGILSRIDLSRLVGGWDSALLTKLEDLSYACSLMVRSKGIGIQDYFYKYRKHENSISNTFNGNTELESVLHEYILARCNAIVALNS